MGSMGTGWRQRSVRYFALASVLLAVAVALSVFFFSRTGSDDEESDRSYAVSPISKGIRHHSLSEHNRIQSRGPDSAATAASEESAEDASEKTPAVSDADTTVLNYRNVSEQLIREGKTQEAVQLYLDAVGKDPSNPALRIELGFAYIENGQLDLGRQTFEQRLQDDPNDPDARFGLGTIEKLNGNIEKALANFNEALRIDPEHIDSKFNMADTVTFDRKQQGTVIEKYLAERYYNDILKEMPDDIDAQNGLAAVYLSTGRVNEAVTLWEDLANKNPGESILMSNLGEAYLAANRPEDAFRSAQKALEVDPENSDAYFFLGSAEIASGNMQAGIEAIRHAAELEPDNPDYQKKLQELGPP